MSSVTIPIFDKSDPKTQNVAPFHLPPTPEWAITSDVYSSTGMAVAGGGMFLKNPMMVWASILLNSLAVVNDQPLRQKEGQSNLLGALGMAAAGIISTTLPRMIIQATPGGGSVRGGSPLGV